MARREKSHERNKSADHLIDNIAENSGRDLLTTLRQIESR